MLSRRIERRRWGLLRAAEAAICHRYGELDLALADIAEDLDCSPRQLQRVFREAAGEDFRSCLLRVRMERAHQLLSRKRIRSRFGQLPLSWATESRRGYGKPSCGTGGPTPSEVQPGVPEELYGEVFPADESL